MLYKHNTKCDVAVMNVIPHNFRDVGWKSGKLF